MKIVGIDTGKDNKSVLLLGPEQNIVVSNAYFNHFTPEIGGYYIRYKDGYESYSPAKAFEEGYSVMGSNGQISTQIENNFSYHKPTGDQPEKYELIRAIGREFAYSIDSYVPNSREKSLAMTKLEEAVMWANAGIARNTPDKEAD